MRSAIHAIRPLRMSPQRVEIARGRAVRHKGSDLYQIGEDVLGHQLHAQHRIRRRARKSSRIGTDARVAATVADEQKIDQFDACAAVSCTAITACVAVSPFNGTQRLIDNGFVQRNGYESDQTWLPKILRQVDSARHPQELRDWHANLSTQVMSLAAAVGRSS